MSAAAPTMAIVSTIAASTLGSNATLASSLHCSMPVAASIVDACAAAPSALRLEPIGDDDLNAWRLQNVLAENPEDGNAMCDLGVCYANGEGVARDPRRAVELYESAVERGCVRAMVNLGICLQQGEGTRQDPKRAVGLYKAAIKEGDVDAECCLGACYVRGEGVGKNVEFAVASFYRAALAGHAGGQRSLGGCYEIGLGVCGASMVKAMHWYELASSQHEDRESLCILAGIYRRGDESIMLAPDMAKAVALYTRAANAGSEEAFRDLALIRIKETDDANERESRAHKALARGTRRSLSRAWNGWWGVLEEHCRAKALSGLVVRSLSRIHRRGVARCYDTWLTRTEEAITAAALERRALRCMQHDRGLRRGWITWSGFCVASDDRRRIATRAFRRLARRGVWIAMDTWIIRHAEHSQHTTVYKAALRFAGLRGLRDSLYHWRAVYTGKRRISHAVLRYLHRRGKLVMRVALIRWARRARKLMVSREANAWRRGGGTSHRCRYFPGHMDHRSGSWSNWSSGEEEGESLEETLRIDTGRGGRIHVSLTPSMHLMSSRSRLRGSGEGNRRSPRPVSRLSEGGCSLKGGGGGDRYYCRGEREGQGGEGEGAASPCFI